MVELYLLVSKPKKKKKKYIPSILRQTKRQAGAVHYFTILSFLSEKPVKMSHTS